MYRMSSIALIAVMGQVVAQPADAEHHEIACNANGYVLQPDTRYRARETIYLGKSCDAYSDAYNSNGRWCWTNAGVLISYDNGERFSMRMELPVCTAIEASVASCMCN